MKTELENAADKYEATEAENRTLVQNMQNRLDNLLKENEELKTTIATKNYEINDLEKSNKVKDEVSNKLRKELNDLKIKVNKRSSPYFPRCGRELWLCLTGHLGKSQVR